MSLAANKDKTRETLRRLGTIGEETDFLLEGQRIKLNPMTSDQFVERKLAEAGIEKDDVYELSYRRSILVAIAADALINAIVSPSYPAVEVRGGRALRRARTGDGVPRRSQIIFV